MFVYKNGEKVYQRDPDWKIKETWEDYTGSSFNDTHTYCQVALDDSGRTFYYRTRNPDIRVGDRVCVPVGRSYEQTVGTVVSMENVLASQAPFPVWKTKYILKKYEESAKVCLLPRQQVMLERYHVAYQGLSLEELINNLEEAMDNHLDDEGEPTEDYDVLDELYDEICDALDDIEE